MKTVCIFHSVDLDGWMSAAIVKHWWELKNHMKYPEEESIEFLGFNYGNEIPDLSGYDKVIMCDVSFPRTIMHELAVEKEFIWIDHHISSINENIAFDKQCYEEKFKGLRDDKFAACELAWMYFFPKDSMPEIVRLLGRYDCFGHKGTEEEQKVLEFQYGARAHITNYEEAYRWLKNSAHYKDNQIEIVIHGNGTSIYKYLCAEAKQSYKNGFDIFFRTDIGEGKIRTDRFICINKERFNPINFGIDYHSDGYDGVACFHFANGKWNFSLYNDNGLVDCSVIAKQYGGGGHKGAAGMVLTPEQFFKEIFT